MSPGCPKPNMLAKPLPNCGKTFWLARHRAGIPGTVAVEDDDVAAVNAADVVDDLVDQHPVVDLQRVFHRPGRDEECLDREGLDHHREQQRDRDQDRELAPERPLPPRALAPRRPGAGRRRLPPDSPAARPFRFGRRFGRWSGRACRLGGLCVAPRRVERACPTCLGVTRPRSSVRGPGVSLVSQLARTPALDPHATVEPSAIASADPGSAGRTERSRRTFRASPRRPFPRTPTLLPGPAPGAGGSSGAPITPAAPVVPATGDGGHGAERRAPTGAGPAGCSTAAPAGSRVQRGLLEGGREWAGRRTATAAR